MPRNALTGGSRASRLEGIPELKENIRKVLDSTSAQQIKGLYMDAAQVLLDEFRADAPVGHPPDDKHPGLFRSAGRIVPGDPNRPYALFFVDRTVAVTTSSKGDSVPYANVIEFGNSHHPPRHTVRNAVTTTRPMIARVIADGFRNILERTLQK